MRKKPRVLNKKTDDIPEDAVYVGRPTMWGNPFVIGEHGTREEVVAMYKERAMESAIKGAAKRELKGKDLVCWCAPQACHADVLLAIANQE